MKINNLSASSRKTWEQCKLMFYAKKILKVPEPPPHPKVGVGRAVHDCYEHGFDDRYPLGIFDQACKYNDVTDPELRQDTWNLIRTCDEWGWWDHFNDYEYVMAEQKFAYPLTAGIPILGYIDLLEKKGNKARIRDIKTQGKAFTREEMKKNIQAETYNLGARFLYPEIEGMIRVEFWVLRHKIQSSNQTPENAEKTRIEYEELADEILSAPDNQLPEPSVGNHCRFCPYYNECPAYK